jgi:hypothetical protein
MSVKITGRRTPVATAVGVSCVALAMMVAAGPAIAAGSGNVHPGPSSEPLTAHTILSGSSHGWSSPDDLTSIGSDLFVSFQNGVPSTGGSIGTPSQSTIVKFKIDGTIEHTWQLTGKCDGLTADSAHHQVLATVNEDGNSSLYSLPVSGGDAASHYAYDASPLPHGGGTDSITIDHGTTYVAASAPVSGGPALYQITLRRGIAHLAAAPFYDSSSATVANAGSEGALVNLALTDPDSSTVVPRQSRRFAGDFMLDSQGDQQAIFASHLGGQDQRLQVLKLSQSIDDTAFPTGDHGALLTTDSTANSVVLITGALKVGTAYAAVTPGNANSAGSNPPPNYLGTIDLNTGTINPVPTAGQPFTPHALIYLPDAS